MSRQAFTIVYRSHNFTLSWDSIQPDSPWGQADDQANNNSAWNPSNEAASSSSAQGELAPNPLREFAPFNSTQTAQRAPEIDELEIEPVELKPEVVPNLAAMVVINGKRFGKPEQFNLKGNDDRTNPTWGISFVVAENLPGDVTIRAAAVRQFDSTNVYRHPFHDLFISMDPANIRKFSFESATEFLKDKDIPEEFGLSREEFEPEGKLFLKFHVLCDETSIRNRVPSKLVDAGCEKTFHHLADVLYPVQIGAQSLQVFAVLRDNPRSRALLAKTKRKCYVDAGSHPTEPRIKDSNLKGLAERPALPQTGWIQRKKYIYHSNKEWQVDLSYGASEEQNLQLLTTQRIAKHKALACITEVPKSRKRDNENDNLEPKALLFCVRWNKDLEKPKMYEAWGIETEYDAPEVKKYVGTYPKPQEVEQQPEEGQEVIQSRAEQI